MALPKASQRDSRAHNPVPPRAPVEESGRWDRFHRADAGPHAEKPDAYGSVSLSQCRQPEASEADILGALDRALGCILEATRAQEGGLLVMDDSSRELVYALVRGDTSKNRFLWRRPPSYRNRARRPATRSPASDGNDASRDDGFHGGKDVAVRFCNGFHITAPLFDGNEVLGVIEVFNKKNGNRFSRSDHNNLIAMSHLISPVLIQLREHQAETLARQ